MCHIMYCFHLHKCMYCLVTAIMATRATDKKYDHLFQLLLCGDSSVGKTCLISRFADNEFRHTHINTIGENYYTNWRK